jgi:hypothetical protein
MIQQNLNSKKSTTEVYPPSKGGTLYLYLNGEFLVTYACCITAMLVG